MKILSVCIPCDQDTMSIHGVVETCKILKNDIEIVFIKDNVTLDLQSDITYLKNKYPDTIVEATRNDYLDKISGLYLKVVEANNKIIQATLVQVITTLKDLLRVQANIDFIVCDKEYTTTKRKKDIVTYQGYLPLDTPIEWHQVKNISSMPLLTNQSVIYKTASVKELGFNITSYTSFTKLALVILPVSKAKSFFYIDNIIELSNKDTIEKYTNESSESIQLIKDVIDTIDISEIKSRKARAYVTRHCITLFSQLLHGLYQQKSEEAKKQYIELQEYFKRENYVLYCHCKKTFGGKILTSKNTAASKLLKKSVK